MLKDANSMIRIDNVSWKVTAREDKILDNISMNFEAGEIYGILGANGAGKSSLLRLISRLQKATSGQIFIDDRDIVDYSRQDLAKKIAYMQQSFQPNVDFSVYEIVAMGREVYRQSFSPLRKRDKMIIDESMKAANCLHLKDDSIMTLSGGERQRVAFAKAIAQDTDWLLLDEPIANLDIKHQLEIMEKVKELNANHNKTIIAVLHDLNMAANTCTKLVFLKNGRLVACGNTQDVMTEEILKTVYDIDFEILHRNDRYMIAPKR